MTKLDLNSPTAALQCASLAAINLYEQYRQALRHGRRAHTTAYAVANPPDHIADLVHDAVVSVYSGAIRRHQALTGDHITAARAAALHAIDLIRRRVPVGDHDIEEFAAARLDTITAETAAVGRPVNIHELRDSLRLLPRDERVRLARLLADTRTAAALSADANADVFGMTREAGQTYESVAQRLGVSTSAVNRAVSAHRARMT